LFYLERNLKLNYLINCFIIIISTVYIKFNVINESFQESSSFPNLIKRKSQPRYP